MRFNQLAITQYIAARKENDKVHFYLRCFVSHFYFIRDMDRLDVRHLYL